MTVPVTVIESIASHRHPWMAVTAGNLPSEFVAMR